MAEGNAGSEAPFLHQYFGEVQTFANNLTSDFEAMMAMAMDPDAEKKIKEKHAELKEKCAPLLEQSFNHHNPSGSGTLSKEEADVFFAHLVHEEGDFIKAVASSVMANVIAGMLQMLAGMVPPEQRPEVEAQIRAQMKKAQDQTAVEVAKASADYEANTAERNLAAFAVIDVDKDGSIQKSEFVAAMDFDGEKANEFQKALGFDGGKIGGGKGEGKGCPMQ